MSIFGKAFKGLKKVAKLVAKPVAATVARTVVGSVPVLGGVVSAVGAVKHALHPPTHANTANLSSRTGVPGFGHPNPLAHRRYASPRSRTPRFTAHRAPTTKRRATSGGTAKQRAARARFAKAAKRGRIRKGARL